MHLEVSLAGFSSNWLYRGSRSFSAWAEAKPWLRDGGVCVIRTGCAGANAVVVASVTRFAHGINGGERPLDVRRIDCGDDYGTPIEALLQDFELDPTISPFGARERIGNRQLDRSLLLVFVESAPIDPGDWEKFVDLLEHYRKAAKPVRLSVVIVDSRGVVHSEPVCEYLTGRASHPLLSDTSSVIVQNLAWPSYLHHRAAWEAGGSLGYALSLDAKLEGCDIGDDEELERRLQAHADAALLGHPARQALFELAGVDRKSDNMQPLQEKSLKLDLFAKGLLWRPPSINSLHIVPWASRALLALASVPETQVWILRHQLICAPLASEILSLCLKFESQIQTKLHGRQDPGSVSQKTVDSHNRFKEGRDEFVVYPDAFPMRPERTEDLWAFASLGENLKSCPPGVVPDMYWSTLHLRNAIAHGHYVGWHHVSLARRMLESFDR